MAACDFSPFLIALVPTALLTACADQGAFPSLAPRPVERLSNEEPVRIAPFVVPDQRLSAQIAALLADARQGGAGFRARLPAARASVGRAAAPGSESWIEAQQAVSALEAARAASAIALTHLDRLAIERASRPTNAGDFAALMTAIEQVEALVAGQQAEIDRLREALPPV